MIQKKDRTEFHDSYSTGPAKCDSCGVQTTYLATVNDKEMCYSCAKIERKHAIKKPI